MTPPPIPPADPARRFGRAGRVTPIPLALAVALVVAALALALAPRHGGKNSANPAGTPAANSQTGKGSDSACGLPAGDQTVPTSPPVSTKWELVGKTAAPTAPATYGPGNKTGVRSCFAHSPTGALYAAANYIAVSQSPDTHAAAARQLMAAGAGRDKAIAKASSATDFPVAQVLGFNFLSYDATHAVIDVAVRGAATDASPLLIHIPMTMRWEGGDWKLVVADDGEAFRRTQQLQSLDGYVPWTGV